MKKKLFFINGATCVGKSTVSHRLMNELPNCGWLDGGWCFNMNPRTYTDETKMVRYDNDCHIINNYIHLSEIENIVFCDTINTQKTIDQFLAQLDLSHVDVYQIVLTINEKAYKRRLSRAIKRGEKAKFFIVVDRGKYICEKSIPYRLSQLQQYEQLDGIKIDTSNLTVGQVVEKIKQLPEQVASMVM